MTVCQACRAAAPDGARFCPSCGAELAGAAAPEEMLKLVTVLFADVVGSTARAETMHPEEVRELMADYFSTMAGEIQAEGGTIEKFVGDAIMAVFGVPTAHEDDAVRAVRASRRMLARLKAWNEARDPAHRLELRIGLNTGEVIASGAPGGELLVTGDAVNVAARLQQAADPGTIVIGDRSARAARAKFDLRPVAEPLALKGKTETVAAWVVVGEREDAEPRDPGLIAPLVGREAELASLHATYDRVRRERHPALVTLLGDAGMGKSRLVREFISPLEVDAKLLIGRCLPYGEGVTLWPLAEMLKAEAVVLDTDSSDEAVGKIGQLVDASIDADLAGDRSRTRAALASTLGLRTRDDPLAPLDPRERYRELVGAWLALFAAMARRGPVVAVVEDLHWADPTMLDVLDELAERLDGPILLVCTARPDLQRSRPDWGGGRRSFSSVPLEPLTTEEGAQLVSALLDVDALSERVRQRTLERSEGNPFFVEEIVRRLIDDGLVVREGDRWRAREGIEDLDIPDNVQAVILARLDLLSAEEKRVAQRAAVVGRTFWDGAVATLADVEDVEAALRTLRRREFIVERLSSTIAREREYAFKHVLVRDVAYGSMPRRERGRAHAEAARWIERTSGERAHELAELLAHHYDAAYAFGGEEGDRRKARAHLLAAAASAAGRFAIQQGERLARRAIELSEEPAERVEALEALGDLHYLTYFGDEAWHTYREALSHVSEHDAAFARLAGKAGLFGARWIGTMHEHAPVEEVDAIIEAGLRAAPQPGRERTRLLVDRGFLLVQRQDRRDEATEAAVREAEAAAEELGDADLLSAALDLVQGWEFGGGRYGDAYRTTLRRNALIPLMTDVKEIGDSHAMAAWTAQHVGRYREAEAHATTCVEWAHGIDPGSYLHGLAWRVAARFMLGDWDNALADQAEIERVAGEDPRELPAGYTLRGYMFAALCHELRGERGDADRYVEIVRRYRAQVADSNLPSLRASPLALVVARRGRFDEAVELAGFVPHTMNAGVAVTGLCEIEAMRGRWDEAPRLVAAAREEAEHGGQLSVPLYADRLEGRAAAVAGNMERAAELLRASAVGFAELEARWEEAWSRLLLAEVLAETDRQRAERELAASLHVFEELRSVAERDRAHALLGRITV